MGGARLASGLSSVAHTFFRAKPSLYTFRLVASTKLVVEGCNVEKNAGTRWDKDDENLLAKLWRDGLTKKEMARRLFRTVQSVEKKASDLKLPHRTPRGQARGPTTFDGARVMESSMRKQDQKFIEAMLKAGYVMAEGASTLNSSGSSR